MSGFSIHPTPYVHVFRTPNNKLQIRTEVKFQRKTVLVRRTSIWYDTVEKKNKKRVELQQFNCDEEEEYCVENVFKHDDIPEELFMKNHETAEEVDKYKIDMYLTTY